MNKIVNQDKNTPFGIIYKVICKMNGKIYIGQTIKNLNGRKAGHKHQAFKGDRRCIFQQALLDEGFENFVWEQIDTADSKEELDKLEKYYIKKYKCDNPKFGYNNTDGGVCGKPNEEVRQKLRDAQTSERRLRVSEALKGRVFSEESCKKMSVSCKGRKFTEEHKRKLSEAKKGKKQKRDYVVKRIEARIGTKINNYKYDNIILQNIRKALTEGEKGIVIAKRYGVSNSFVSQIKNGRTRVVNVYKNVFIREIK